MGQLRSALSTALLTGNTPAEALELLDRFAARLPGATASTAACLVLDWNRGSIRWARAGHPPPLLLSGGRTRFLADEGAGTVLGVPGRRPYTEGAAEIEPGDVLLLYTDGLVERRGENLDDGLERLAAAVRRHGAEAPDRLASLLLHEILADTDQPDDVALIAARLVPAPLDLRLPADPAQLAGLRRMVLAWATDVGVAEETLDDLQLAVGEAVANAVEHAYREQTPGTCAVRLARGADGAIEARVEDDGTWRPVPADAGFRGRGLLLIRRLAEDVTVEQGPAGGTTIRFRVPAAPVRDEGPRRHLAEAVRGHGVTLQVLGGRVELAGELDLASTQEVAPGLFAALGSGSGEATLDLRRVTYLASAGLGLLLEAAERCRAGHRPLRVLVDPAGSPARILELAGLGALITDQDAVG
jgi:anti-anti-sigma factor